MRLRYLSLLLILLLASPSLFCPEERPGTNTAVISLFFRPLTPSIAQQLAEKDVEELLGEEAKTKEAPVSPKELEDEFTAPTPFLHGIYVSYQGTVATSDYNGQVLFPNHQTKPSLTVVITDSLTPIIIFSNTVQHMKVREGHDAIFYEVTRERDPKLKKFVWDIHMIPTPANGRIPDDALVIIAKPSQIVMLEGKIVTEQDVNLLLPPVYIRTTITPTDNALQFMKMAKFFAPIEKQTSYASDRYATMLIR